MPEHTSPICTRRVFFKYYTDAEDQQIHLWSGRDRECYMEAMLSNEGGVVRSSIATSCRRPSSPRQVFARNAARSHAGRSSTAANRPEMSFQRPAELTHHLRGEFGFTTPQGLQHGGAHRATFNGRHQMLNLADDDVVVSQESLAAARPRVRVGLQGLRQSRGEPSVDFSRLESNPSPSGEGRSSPSAHVRHVEDNAGSLNAWRRVNCQCPAELMGTV